MHRFSTEIEIQQIGSHNSEPFTGKDYVAWNLDLEVRGYGVKNFAITAPDQNITLIVTKYNEETDEEYEEEVTLQLKDIEVETEFNQGLYGLIPQRMVIYNGKATLEFE